jgi:hypothetical protein
MLYLINIFENYTTASALISLRIIFKFLQKIFLSSFKDRVDFKYVLSLAELSSAIGYIFYGLSIFIPNFILELIILGLFFDALGGSLWGDTFNASVYVNFESGKNKDKGATPYGKLQTILMIGIGLGQMTGGALAAAYSYNFAMWFGAIPNIIAALLALTLKKSNRVKSKSKENPIKHFYKASREIFNKKDLTYICFGNVSRNMIVRAFNEFLLPFYKTFFNVSVIGMFLAVKQIVGGVTFWFSGNIVKKLGFGNSVKYSLVLRTIFETFALVFNIYLSPIFLTIRTLVYAPMETSLEYTMQQKFNDKDRTTMSAVIGVLTNIGSSIFLILVGFIADLTSVWWAMIFMLPLKIIPYYFYNKAFKIIEAR